MATIINNPQPTQNSGGRNFLIGIILLIIVVVLFFYYGMPLIRSNSSPTINVPGNVNVNVHTPSTHTQ